MQLPPLYTSAYRYPNEQIILWLTVLLVLAVIAISATVTLCASAVFVLVIAAISYFSIRSHHQALLSQALPVTDQTTPELAELAQQCAIRLQPKRVEVFVTESPVLNAYTFGVSSPSTVVIHSGLLAVMDADEMAFVIGHEMGHARLGHTLLNTLLGGMAGIPSPMAAAAILVLAFRWWNRACEFSADRAGMLACGRPEKAISALLKLAVGPGRHTPAQLENALRQLEGQEEDAMGLLGEALSTHPLIARRIRQIREYAASAQYKALMRQPSAKMV
ncbi:MAG TPA: M48 family metallopeptidase [Anaerolineaceae bacterium]|jgi:Zn-dependent protease with chaperone function